MHPLRHPRNAVVVGAVFAVTGALYWAIPYFGHWLTDYAGFTMLVALGIAMTLMAYVLVAGSPRD